jgi:hypothetical protein
MRGLHVWLLAAAVGGTLFAGPAAAAPDATLGMALLSARVAANGALLQVGSSGAQSSTKIGTGTYEIFFARNIDDCIPLTTALSGAFVGLSATVGDTGVRIVTRTRSSSTPIDLGFTVVVFCPR